jgi:hypothetical protein
VQGIINSESVWWDYGVDDAVNTEHGMAQWKEQMLAIYAQFAKSVFRAS